MFAAAAQDKLTLLTYGMPLTSNKLSKHSPESVDDPPPFQATGVVQISPPHDRVLAS